MSIGCVVVTFKDKLLPLCNSFNILIIVVFFKLLDISLEVCLILKAAAPMEVLSLEIC